VLIAVTASMLILVPLAAGATQRGTAVPSATTDNPSSITATSVKLNGHSTLNCPGSRGFKLASPGGTANLSGAAGAGSSAFSLAVTSLQPGTPYAYTAFATDCGGTASGSPLVFMTLARVNLTINGAGKVTGGISCTAS
jgi:hypothetical protein